MGKSISKVRFCVACERHGKFQSAPFTSPVKEVVVSDTHKGGCPKCIAEKEQAKNGK